jgi:hypothetical protein
VNPQTAFNGLMTPVREIADTIRRKLMSSVGPFPVKFAGLEECPDPFREPLRRALNPSEAVLEIIYSLAFVTGRLCLPASVFCVTNRQWIMVHESKSGDVCLDSAIFADTLLIELTAILLYGRTKRPHANL